MIFHWVTFTLILAIGLARSDAQDVSNLRGAKIFFKSYSTRTLFTVSFATSTVPFTCFSVVKVAACRRKRRQAIIPVDLAISDLDSSVSNISPSLNENDGIDNRRKGKILFTLWSTTTSTLTATSFVTNHSVTLSIGLNCAIPNRVYNLC